MSRTKVYTLVVVLLALFACAALRPLGAGADMTGAAKTFLGTLSGEQRTQAVKKFDDMARTDWHFIPKETRKGLQLKEMNDEQRKAADALLVACLSEAGHKKARTIMELEGILHAAETKSGKGKFVRDPQRYYFTIFGEPGDKGKWGLSVEGHHLSLNFVVADGKLVSHTPAFFGANPAVVKENHGVGPQKGTRVLADEELLGFKLLHSLNPEQRKTAIIAEKAPADIRGPAGAQPPQSPPEGVAAAKFDESQIAILRKLLAAVAEKLRSECSEADLAAIDRAGIEKVYFAWAGAEREGIGHYYRLQGPTFLVEFVNTQPDADGRPANHIHSVWRDLQHGDFGLPLKK